MAALGAARLALVGNNNSSFSEVLYKPNIVKIILPNSNKLDSLMNRFHLWKKIYNHNKPIAQVLNKS